MPIRATRILLTYPISLVCVVCHKRYHTVDDFENHLYFAHEYRDGKNMRFSRYNQVVSPPDEYMENEAPVARDISMCQLIDHLFILFTKIVLYETIRAIAVFSIKCLY